ncbi:hypothetical protein EBME_0687 [bacterium endosymbiont of Mortierella elongata FMR23-6]|nr:hypothetical protein EBME_0687 [bacterium endosymbiont of Mortierella elongata FMR23-6]
MRERIIKAHQALEKAPDSKVGQKELERARQCQALFDERLAARKIHNGKGEVFISAQEPKAVVQRLKRGRGFAASYKPSVLANEDRIVVAHALHASSETRVMATMLETHYRAACSRTAARSGYFDNTVIQCTLDREISLLCSPDKSSEEVEGEKKFRKGQFQYDAIQDTYRCPAGQDLHVITQTKPTALTRARRIYAIMQLPHARVVLYARAARNQQ